MTAFVTFVGWFVIAMLCLAVACGMVCLVLYCFDKAMQRRDRAIAAETLSEAGRAIEAAGWWFSEHPPTSLAIRILGDRMLHGLAANPDAWRDQWRKGYELPSKQVSEPEQHG